MAIATNKNIMKNRNRYGYGSPESIAAKFTIKLFIALMLLPLLAISGALNNSNEVQPDTNYSPRPTRTIRALDQ